MMRSWGNRPDTFVCDEPLYAHYLLTKGITNHPGYRQTIADHETDWQKVVEWLTGRIPEGKPVFYQKHMAHHVLPGMSLAWIDNLTNCLLIREPREMLTSLREFLPEPELADTGLPHQLWLFEHLRSTQGRTPPILDSRDVLNDPAAILGKLCDCVGLKFLPDMLSWKPGLRSTDGAWAPFWYNKVAETTSFGTYRPKDDVLPDKFLPLLEECEAIYQRLYEFRIT
jgi:hypothetical protein